MTTRKTKKLRKKKTEPVLAEIYPDWFGFFLSHRLLCCVVLCCVGSKSIWCNTLTVITWLGTSAPRFYYILLFHINLEFNDEDDEEVID